MEQTFIKKIIIKKIRHLENITIPLSDNKLKHLILTGKNGSGKTSVLDALSNHLSYVSSTINSSEEAQGISKLDISEMFGAINWNEHLNEERSVIGEYDYDSFRSKARNGKFIIAYYHADRKVEMEQAENISKVAIKDVYAMEDNPGKKLLNYMVGMKATAAFAKQSENADRAEEINQWFERFEDTLKKIYSDPNLKLNFNIENFDFTILTEGHEPFNFNQMSSGYSAIFSIVNDLIMRSEKPGRNVEGIVLIDEIETHLHLELQRIILPILTNLFPQIQFIVATHSPFVLNSLENAVIYDLENGNLIQNGLSEYPYEAIVEAYYNTDRLSYDFSQKIKTYREYCTKEDLSAQDWLQIRILQDELDEIPDFLSPDIAAEYSRLKLELNNRRKKHGEN